MELLGVVQVLLQNSGVSPAAGACSACVSEVRRICVGGNGRTSRWGLGAGRTWGNLRAECGLRSGRNGGFASLVVGVVPVGVAVAREFSRRQSTERTQSGNGANMDLELEIMIYMQQSGNPDAFPSKEELIAAGRIDLVQAIIAQGGWLADGWGTSQTVKSSRNRSSRKRNRRSKSKAPSSARGSTDPRNSHSRTALTTDELWVTSSERVRTVDAASRGMQSEQSLEDVSVGKRGNDNGVAKKGRKMEANLRELSSDSDGAATFPQGRDAVSRIPSNFHQYPRMVEEFASPSDSTNDGKPQIQPRNRSRDSAVRRNSLETPNASGIDESEGHKNWAANAQHEGFDRAKTAKPELERETSGGRYARGDVVDVELGKKKRGKSKNPTDVEVSSMKREASGALDWINQMVDQREKWMLEADSRSQASSTARPKSVQDRIRSLEAKLAATRTALQSGREALWKKGDGHTEIEDQSNQVYKQRLAQLEDTSDELEFCENKILRSFSELSTTRAQVAALEGKYALEIMEVHKNADENERKIGMAQTALRSLRTVRVVWPYPAKEVFLIGSFDGWNLKMKMEESSAGVFVASLHLHPGVYEMKFIVDGTWRVDTARQIVYGGVYENNVLKVS